MEKITSNTLLGATAAWTAAVRAGESKRTDHLFEDPWAEMLAGEPGMAWIASRSADSVIPIVIRTRYFDDFLLRITQEQGISQVVLLAAGLDTRAFRLQWPTGTTLFELDLPDVLAYKEEILHSAKAQPACTRHVVGTDLTMTWTEVLMNEEFDPKTPSLWLLEGFLFYLPNETGTHILDALTELAAPGSWLGFDIINATTLTSTLTQKWIEMQAQSGAPWIGTMDDPAAFMAQRGWAASLTQAGAEDAHYGRWPYPVIPTTMPDMPHNWFVTAKYDPDHTFG